MIWLRTRGPRFAAIALVVVVAACSGGGKTPVPHGSGGLHISLSSAGPSAAAPSAARETSGSATLDNVTADYTYKSELITPIAHLYGSFLDDFVIVELQNDNDAAVRVIVKSQIEEYTDESTDTVTVDAHGQAEVRQNPTLTQEAIDGLTSAHQADLHVVVTYNDGAILDETSQTTVTSRRDFPWSIKGMTQAEDYNLVAAMVTPTDPSVEALIRKAANYDPNHAMTSGYDSDQDASGSVWDRLSDIWQAETTDYKLTYISTMVTFVSGSSQRIRLPAEVLDQASGNCIELTLLYASAVEALGMQPDIVILPDHAYLGVRLDGSNDMYYFVETTMIGQADFQDAVKEASTEWDDTQPHIASGDDDYGWVDVASARQNGITPIPWHRT